MRVKLAVVLMGMILLAACSEDGPTLRTEPDRPLEPATGAVPVPPAGGVVEIGPVPASPAAFQRLRARLARTPEGAAALMVTVMLACSENENRGMTFATMLLHPDRLRAGRLWQGREPGQHYRDMLRIAMRKPFVARSYLKGANPADGYAPAEPYRVLWLPHAHSRPGNDQIRLLLRSSGADRPRPVTLKKGPDGLWAVYEASSLFVGVRPPRQ